jgi:hypothetical protein
LYCRFTGAGAVVLGVVVLGTIILGVVELGAVELDAAVLGATVLGAGVLEAVACKVVLAASLAVDETVEGGTIVWVVMIVLFLGLLGFRGRDVDTKSCSVVDTALKGLGNPLLLWARRRLSDISCLVSSRSLRSL